MRWENKRYTPEELRKMQQEAVERVRQMQRRSQEVVHNSPRAPSFFAQNQEQDGHAEHSEASAPSEPEKAQTKEVQEAANTPHSPQQNSAQQTQQTQTDGVLSPILDVLHLDQDKLLLLGLLFILWGEKTDRSLMLALAYLLL